MDIRVPIDRLRTAQANRELRRQIDRLKPSLVADPVGQSDRPVLFFNASTRIHRLSQNGAFGLLASWAVRRAGIPVRYAVCRAGMDLCVLGTDRRHPAGPPPCKACLSLSSRLFPQELLEPIQYDASRWGELSSELAGESIESLTAWQLRGIAVGELCLPGLRWALRRHHLPDDETTRAIFRRYLVSAASLIEAFEGILDDLKPRALVIFNGIFYPEAVARHVAVARGIPVVTHEVGLQPFSAFFSHEHATFRQVHLPPDIRLAEEQDQQLDAYLEDRFKGRFTMAGIEFWPEIQSTPAWLVERIGQHQQTVSVFTNVIFDTSQIHANRLFDDMFDWLEDIAQVIRNHPETLFVIRAHPDEDRQGKASQESVATWIRETRLDQQPNVVFLAPDERLNSYELIRRSRFVLVYNSSIGLEASIMGFPVLCAGRARYTQIPTVFYPGSRADYMRELETLLESDDLRTPPQFIYNSRAFLYYELYRASLDFSPFLSPFPGAPGMVRLADFDLTQLDRSPSLEAIRRGILDGEPFILSEDLALGRSGS
ncbi:MAG TPA: hypothetical protein VJK02_09835 [Anaerolineales bacterium]|nr:hypothetical protein [Anaerolineales bacterium]